MLSSHAWFSLSLSSWPAPALGSQLWIAEVRTTTSTAHCMMTMPEMAWLQKSCLFKGGGQKASSEVAFREQLGLRSSYRLTQSNIQCLGWEDLTIWDSSGISISLWSLPVASPTWWPQGTQISYMVAQDANSAWRGEEGRGGRGERERT